MKLVRYKYQDKTSCGVMGGKTILHQVRGTVFGKLEKTGVKHRLSQVQLLTPCQPSKVIAVGINYHALAKQAKRKVPKEPMVFLMPSTAIVGPDDDVVYPPISKSVYFEAELGVVIGKKAKNVPEEKALDYVLGYTCVNDITAMDLSGKEAQLTRSKSMDTFCPIGPCIETDLDADNVLIESYLNDEVKQSTYSSDMVFNVAQIIAYVTEAITLLPGDVISTGTPPGLAPLQIGDTIEIRIPEIGTLRNRVVSP